MTKNGLRSIYSILLALAITLSNISGYSINATELLSGSVKAVTIGSNTDMTSVAEGLWVNISVNRKDSRDGDFYAGEPVDVTVSWKIDESFDKTTPVQLYVPWQLVPASADTEISVYGKGLDAAGANGAVMLIFTEAAEGYFIISNYCIPEDLEAGNHDLVFIFEIGGAAREIVRSVAVNVMNAGIMGAGIPYVLDAGKPIDGVIDKLNLHWLYEPNEFYAELLFGEPNTINTHGEFKSVTDIQLDIEWSIKSNDVKAGDYFTIGLPGEIMYFGMMSFPRVSKITDNNPTDPQTIADYTIDIDNNGDILITVVFTDYIEKHANVKGDMWCRFITANFSAAEEIEFEFNINGNVAANGSISVQPQPPPVAVDPSQYNNAKFGTCNITHIAGNFYYFTWTIYLNMDFGVIESMRMEDIIPDISPHKFISPGYAQSFGMPELSDLIVREYTGADGAQYDDQKKRSEQFKKQYNSRDYYDYWENHMELYNITNDNDIFLNGVDSGAGINKNSFILDDKKMTLDLGRITRPTLISYRTISELELIERSLENPDIVGQLKNSVFINSVNTSNSYPHTAWFDSGGSGLGYNYGFNFTKTDESGNPLENAQFALYENANCSGPVHGLAISDQNGNVSFSKLRIGTYYLKETNAPDGCALDDTVYKIEIDTDGKSKIYYGENFTKELLNREIKNSKIIPVKVALKAIKALEGAELQSGMFTFELKEVGGAGDGNIIDSKTNDSDGNIIFDTISYAEPGVYKYTITEINGGLTGYMYDETVYEITISVFMQNDKLEAIVNYAVKDDSSSNNKGEALFTNKCQTVLYHNTSLSISKADSSGEVAENELIGYEFKLYYKADYEGGFQDAVPIAVFDTHNQNADLVLPGSTDVDSWDLVLVETKAPDNVDYYRDVIITTPDNRIVTKTYTTSYDFSGNVNNEYDLTARLDSDGIVMFDFADSDSVDTGESSRSVIVYNTPSKKEELPNEKEGEFINFSVRKFDDGNRFNDLSEFEFELYYADTDKNADFSRPVRDGAGNPVVIVSSQTVEAKLEPVGQASAEDIWIALVETKAPADITTAPVAHTDTAEDGTITVTTVITTYSFQQNVGKEFPFSVSIDNNGAVSYNGLNGINGSVITATNAAQISRSEKTITIQPEVPDSGETVATPTEITPDSPAPPALEDQPLLAAPPEVPPVITVEPPIRILDNGYSLVPAEGTVDEYILLDKDVVPLGYIKLPEDKSILDFDEFELIDLLIPLGKINPKTGDEFPLKEYTTALIILIMIMIAISMRINKLKE